MALHHRAARSLENFAPIQEDQGAPQIRKTGRHRVPFKPYLTHLYSLKREARRETDENGVVIFIPTWSLTTKQIVFYSLSQTGKFCLAISGVWHDRGIIQQIEKVNLTHGNMSENYRGELWKYIFIKSVHECSQVWRKIGCETQKSRVEPRFVDKNKRHTWISTFEISEMFVNDTKKENARDVFL